jgi:hypothetical protein
MPKLTEELHYNGAREKTARLGLSTLVDEVKSIALGFDLRVKEEKDSNGGAAVRKLIDAQFENAGGWTKKQTGEVDWTKCRLINGTRVCIGVEVQFSARSDLLAIDVHHLRRAIVSGDIDIGILLVPDDTLAVFLTDRGTKMADAKRHVEEARAQDLPLILLALRHDGPGVALPKQAKRKSKRTRTSR